MTEHKSKINPKVFYCIDAVCSHQEQLDLTGRNSKGQFILKSNCRRQNRSLRATDEVWSNFGEIASHFGLSRSDLLHLLFINK